VLTTPAIADIDGDGNDELVVAVSYFFDRQYYEKEVRRYSCPPPVSTERAPLWSLSNVCVCLRAVAEFVSTSPVTSHAYITLV
jgi:hypothetical protein